MRWSDWQRSRLRRGGSRRRRFGDFRRGGGCIRSDVGDRLGIRRLRDWRRRHGRRRLHRLLASDQRERQPASQKSYQACDLRIAAGHLPFFFSEGLAEVAEFSGRGVHGARQRQFDTEGSSAPDLRIEFYPTTVQLYKPKRIGQSDPGTPGPGGKEELKYLLLILRRNSFSGISDSDNREFATSSKTEGDSSPGAREIAGVQQQVQHRLMNQLAVHEDGGKFGGQVHS